MVAMLKSVIASRRLAWAFDLFENKKMPQAVSPSEKPQILATNKRLLIIIREGARFLLGGNIIIGK